jgi:hypothetical protein
MNDLTRDEFIANIGYIRDDVKGVHDRLDTLNGRTRTLENAVAVLKDRTNQVASPKDVRNYGAGFGALGASAVGVLYAIWEMVTK